MMSELSRTEVVDGTMTQYRAFADLIRDLDDAAWSSPTRCEGWTVAHVAGHVFGQLDDVANFRYADMAQPDSPDRQAEANFRRAPSELADMLEATLVTVEAIVGSLDDEAWDGLIDRSFGTQTLGDGVFDLWNDTYIHNDDVLDALGRDPVRGSVLHAMVLHAAQVLGNRGWGPATLALEGMDLVLIGRSEPLDPGLTVSGDPYLFVMVTTGRADPALLSLDPSVNVYA